MSSSVQVTSSFSRQFDDRERDSPVVPDFRESIEVKEFLEGEAVKEVVDSIVSVVSGTLTEYMPYGATLHWTGTRFEHSLHCGCECCYQPTTPPSREVRRNLFPDDLDEAEREAVLEDRKCDGCGIYESETIEDNPGDTEFIEVGSGDFPPVRRFLCVSCFTTERNLFDSNTELYCNACLTSYDPDNPCDCNTWFVDREGGISLDDQTYINEYENEELPENNTEKVKVVKESVKEMGELVYELKEKISEGEYLQLMNCLQKITNSANSL